MSPYARADYASLVVVLDLVGPAVFAVPPTLPNPARSKGSQITGVDRRGVFLSYRRDDSSDYAGRLHEGLAHEVGADRVFVDVDSIEPGGDFVRAIEEALDRCHALLALIGPRWLDAREHTRSPPTGAHRRLRAP